MPTPRANESQASYLHRAIPQLMDEGRPQAQSVAIAYSLWRRRNAKKRARKSLPWINVKSTPRTPQPTWGQKVDPVAPALSSVDATAGGSFRAPPSFLWGAKPFHRRKLKKKGSVESDTKQGPGHLITLEEVRKRGAAALERNEPALVEPKALEELEARTKDLGAGWSYKYAQGQYGLDLAIHGEPQFDEQEMSITFPFAASHGRDRVGDFLDVGGIDCTNHKKNPVAFLDHGKAYPLPIGKCESPAGEYTVTLDSDRGLAIATVFLDKDETTQNGKMARQVFSLFKSGILRAGSIGYRPLNTPKKLPAEPKTGTPQGVLLDRVELLEVTLCALPCNGDAVRRTLDEGWGGKAWEPEVRSMLEEMEAKGEPATSSRQDFRQVKTNSAPKQGDGHWVTIGGHSEGDKKHVGGSPVYIEDGRITKGHPSLVGRSISDLKAPAEHGSHRQQLHQERQYSRAKWHKEARKEGINPKDLDALADDMLAHDAAHVEERKQLLKDARETLTKKGYNANALTTNLRSGRVENKIPFFDELVDEMQRRYPSQFAGHGDPEERLISLFTEGNPEKMSADRAYETALDHLKEHGMGGSQVSDKPLFEDEEEDFPFGANAPEPAKTKIPPSPHHASKIEAAWERFNSRHEAGGRGGLFGSGDMAGRAAFSKLPENTPVLITQGQYAGHTAKIVHDKENHRIAAEIDGAPELGLIPVDHNSIEPLSSARSWRTEAAHAPTEQGSLLNASHFLPKREQEEEAVKPQATVTAQFIRQQAEERARRQLEEDKAKGQVAVNRRPEDLQFDIKRETVKLAHENAAKLSEDDFVRLMREGESRKDMARGNAVKLVQQVAGLKGKAGKEEAERALAEIAATRVGSTHFRGEGGVGRPSGYESAGINVNYSFLPSEDVYRAAHRLAVGKKKPTGKKSLWSAWRSRR